MVAPLSRSAVNVNHPVAPVEVLLADQHHLLLELLSRTLAPHPSIRSVHTVADPDALWERIELVEPDVLVLEALFGGLDGLAHVRQLKRQMPDLPVLVLSANDQLQQVARRAGARGFVSKSHGFAALLEATLRVASGKTWFMPVQQKLNIPLSLSERELQVGVMVARGQSTRGIAERLGLSDRTVETYRYRLMGKLNVKGTAAIAAWAVSNGLVAASDRALGL